MGLLHIAYFGKEDGDMHDIEIKPNLNVVVMGEPAVVVKVVSVAQVEVKIFSSRKSMIVDVGDLKFLPSTISTNNLEGDYQLIDKDVPDEIKIKVGERHLAIQRYLNGQITIDQAMSLTNTKKSAFYKLLNKFSEELGASSLYPGVPGREAGQILLSAEIEEVISNAIKKKYKGPAATYVKVWDEVSAQCTKQDLPVPSLSTVVTRIKGLGEREVHRLKYGTESAIQNYGAKPGKINLTHPLEWVQIDHTLVDCILVDEETRMPLFRPWVTLVIDVHTRVILGYYVAFHAPSTVSVACAITHAALPKKNTWRILGVIMWCILFMAFQKYCTWITRGSSKTPS